MDRDHRSSLDARFAHAEAQKRLEQVLQLPGRHPDVSEWLYNDDHRSPILSPEIFEGAKSMSTLSSYMDLAVPVEPPNLEERGISSYSETFMYTLYVPVKVVEGIAVGYTFLTGMPKHGNSFFQLDAFPALQTNRGRYAYDEKSKRLVFFVHVDAHRDAIAQVYWTGDTQRQVGYFIVPHRPYTRDDPPRKIMSAMWNGADCLSPTVRDETCGNSRDSGAGLGNSESGPVGGVPGRGTDDGLPSGPSDYVNGEWREDDISNLPSCMFQNLGDGPHREPSCWLRGGQVRALGKRGRRGGLVHFAKRRVGRVGRADDSGTPVRVLGGRFVGRHVVRDQFDEDGELQVRFACEMRTRSTATGARCLELVRRAGAQLYYSFVLWATTDSRLVVAQARRAAELICFEVGKRIDSDDACDVYQLV